MRLSVRGTRPAGLDTGRIDLDGHARLQQVDRQHEAAFVRLLAYEHAFEADERTLDDADAVALLEVRMRGQRDTRGHETLDGIDFVGRNRRQPGPPAVENPHHATRFQNLHVAGLVHSVPHEEVAGKNRHLRDAGLALASRPYGHLG